jgi:hypothetical protein
MKNLTRDFSTREKALLLILALILIGLLYYWFVDVPVRDGIMSANSKKESANAELVVVNAKIAEMEKMEAELEEFGTLGRAAYMGSYNNAEAEYAALNDILADTDEYEIAFSALTRDGDMVRREFSIQFSTTGYEAAKRIITALENSEYRCRIGDLNCTAEQSQDTDADLKNWTGKILVSAKATYYETMVGGKPDEGLPADKE